MAEYSVALAGNPNCGKTTLLNSLTGTKHYVGNWAGVTVEKKVGHYKHGDNKLELVDLPGTYSLSPYSLEEKIARNYILDENPDVILNIVDAVNMERNLFLTVQLMELGKPMVIALNMMDEARKKGFNIDCKQLEEAIGVPVVPIVALKSEGIDELLDKVVSLASNKNKKIPVSVPYGTDIERILGRLEEEIAHHKKDYLYPDRWLAIKVLEKDEDINHFIEENLVEEINLEENYNDIIINRRYHFISSVVDSAVTRPTANSYEKSDRIDGVMLNRFLGLPIFAAIMYIMFYTTFNLGGIFVDLLDVFFSETLGSLVSQLLISLGVSEWLISLIVEGIIGGVGGVLTFVPNIAILFIFISILEDSGYMSRVAFLLDESMQKIGLNGKTFIPLILGFGCNVPAIMATRTLENERDRLIAILINPFMSCGARFPVYVLIASAFFPGNETLVTFSLYILGAAIAMFVAYIFRRTIFKGDKTHFIMELPPYRIPDLKHLSIHVWDRVKGYIIKAGTVIFAASVVLWFVLNFNSTGLVEITESFGAGVGKIIAPIFKPLGFGTWQSALSLFTGIVAKEIVVANMAIVYGIGGDPSAGEFYKVMSQSFTPLSAYAFMVFVLLYTPCVGVIGVIKRETNSWKWTGFSVIFQFAIAWLVAFLFFQLGSIIF